MFVDLWLTGRFTVNLHRCATVATVDRLRQHDVFTVAFINVHVIKSVVTVLI